MLLANKKTTKTQTMVGVSDALAQLYIDDAIRSYDEWKDLRDNHELD